MNYIIKNDRTYETIAGYVFKTKTGSIAKGLRLAPSDSIDNYEVIEEPVEEEIIEEEKLENLSKEELIERLKNTENQNI